MRAVDSKPYLMSVGVSIPLFGIFGHRYFRVNRKYKMKTFKFLGVRVVWTTYRRIEDVTT